LIVFFHLFGFIEYKYRGSGSSGVCVWVWVWVAVTRQGFGLSDQAQYLRRG